MSQFETRHRLHCDDARNLGGVADATIDLVVTSPPYPMIAMWDAIFPAMNRDIAGHLEQGRGDEAFGLMHRELDRVWEGLFRVLRPGGWVCLNIGDAVRNLGGKFRLYPNHSRVETGMAAAGFDILPPVLWRKASNSPTKFMGSGMLPGGAYVTLEHEFVLLFRKPDPEGKGSKTTPAADRTNRRRRSAIFWEERNLWFSDLWELGGSRQGMGLPGSRERSGAFPLELPFRLVAMFSCQGDTVLDPFAGTGTTALACLALGRHSVGLDLDLKLVDHAGRRLTAGVGEAAGRVRRRLSEHRTFLAGRKEPPRYLASRIGLPVMTRQEQELELTVPVAAWTESGTPGCTVVARHEVLAAAGF